MAIKTLDLRILEICAEAQKKGKSTSMTKILKEVPHSRAEVKQRIVALRTAGFLEGTRALRATSEGLDTHRSLKESMESAREAAQEAAQDTQLAKRAETALTPVERRERLSEALAGEYMVDPDQLYRVIARNVITTGKTDPDPVTPEEVFIVMSLCSTYNLNPFLKHIHAFRSKGKLVTPVGYDGWVHVANTNPRFQGVAYEYPGPDQMVERYGKKVFPWIKATAYVEGRVPTVVVVFLDEFANTENWNDHPNHRLRLKAYTSAVREGLGIALPDEIDGELIIQAERNQANRGRLETQSTSQSLLAEMSRAALTSAGQLGTPKVKVGEPPFPEVTVPNYLADVSDRQHPVDQDPPIGEEPPSTGREGESNE